VAWNDEPLFAIGHHDVAALPGDAVAELFKNTDGIPLADPRKFWHSSNCDEFLSYARALCLRFPLCIFHCYFQPELDRFTNVHQCFGVRRALTMATRQCWTRNGETFFGFDHDDAILHEFRI